MTTVLKKRFISFVLLLIISAFMLSSCIGPVPNSNDQLTGDTKDSMEPNDTWQTAYNITTGVKYDATIHEESDVDYYKFKTTNSTDSFDKVNVYFTNVGSEFAPYVSLLDENGQELVGKDGSKNEGADWTFSFIGLGGTYILKVYGDNGFDKTTTGKYSFKVVNMNANDKYDPNHSPETAAQIPLNTKIDGTILSTAERDYYIIQDDHQDYWQMFELDFTDVSSDFRVNYEILDKDKNSVNWGVASNAGANLSLKFPVKTTQFYVFVDGVDHVNDGTTGDYSMKVSVVDTNDDNEPDDTFEEARVINTYPSNLSGKIITDAANDNDGDWEFFKITVKAGKKVTWNVTPSASDTELHFYVYDSNKSKVGHEDGNDGQPIGFYINNPSSSDLDFYIKLGGFLGDSHDGSYTINFTETNADNP